MNSGAYATQSRRGRDERPFSFFLHDGEERIQILDPLFGNCNRLDDFLIGHRNGLTHLLKIYPQRGRDVIRVVSDCVRVTHDRIDVTVDPVEHVADFRVALPEIPRCGNERNRQHQQRDRRQAARVCGDLVERAYFRLDLPRDDCVG